MAPFNPREKAKQVISDGKAHTGATPSRVIGVGPPPREAPSPATEPPIPLRPAAAVGDSAPPKEREELLAPPQPSARIEPPPQTQGAGDNAARKTPGVRQYRRQVVTVHLGASVRALIDEAVVASKGKPPPSRGGVAMEAIRATHEGLESEFALPPSDPFFGPPAVARRQPPLEGGERMTLRFSITEAVGLAELRDRTTLSISGLVSEAVERYWGPRLTTNRRNSGWGERSSA